MAIFLGYMTRTYAFIDDTAPAAGGRDACRTLGHEPEMEFTDDAKRMQDTELYRVRGVPASPGPYRCTRACSTSASPAAGRRLARMVGLDDATLVGGPPRIVGAAGGPARPTA